MYSLNPPGPPHRSTNKNCASCPTTSEACVNCVRRKSNMASRLANLMAERFINMRFIPPLRPSPKGSNGLHQRRAWANSLDADDEPSSKASAHCSAAGHNRLLTCNNCRLSESIGEMSVSFSILINSAWALQKVCIVFNQLCRMSWFPFP
jgi:hypothetical protein